MFLNNYIFEYSKNIQIRPFASEIIKKLIKKHKIIIITARDYTTFENKYQTKMQDIVKKWLCDNNNRVIATSNLPFGSKGAARSQLLLEAINYAIPHVTTSDVRQYLEYSRRYYQNIFQSQPIDFE